MFFLPTTKKISIRKNHIKVPLAVPLWGRPFCRIGNENSHESPFRDVTNQRNF